MVKFFDIFNPNKEKLSEKLLADRLSICVNCPSYISITHQCKECGCFMPLKAKLKDATCPLRKW